VGIGNFLRGNSVHDIIQYSVVEVDEIVFAQLMIFAMLWLRSTSTSLSAVFYFINDHFMHPGDQTDGFE
jgi:hypothetical protein